MSVILCPHCGTTNRAGSNFCNRCGANLQRDDLAEEPPIAQRTNDEVGADGGEAAPSVSATVAPEEGGIEQTLARPPYERRRPPESSLSPQTTPDPDDDWSQAPELAELSPFTTTRRLVMGVQGLLDPVQLARELGEAREVVAPPEAPPLALPAEQLRRIRTLLTDDPVLLDAPLPIDQLRPPRLHLPWLILLISGVLAIPILFDLRGPVGAPRQWPGVAEAHALIDGLPADATVLLLWAYDAATAAELDLVALPLASHLLERRIQPVIVSQLPGGPAVAERLFQRAADGLRADTTFQFTAARELYINAGYLPGGAAVLTWVAQNPNSALVRHSALTPQVAPLAGEGTTQPELTIVLADQAEAVQQWLEQGQPIQQRPTLAYTSAGADPILRPYLTSGQLGGLVSGFDGAIHYQGLRAVRLAAAEEDWVGRQVVLQNWGHFALLLLLLLGNLAAWNRGGRDG